MNTTANRFFLEPSELRVLNGLKLNPRKTFSGRIRGERLTKRKGISIEFADYRDYTDGDDLRHLDWNILARLGQPVIKTYQDEEDLAVYLLLDCSASMDFGDPSKFSTAQRLAMALGFVGLASQDAVLPRPLGVRERPLPPLRGSTSLVRLAKWVQGMEPKADRSLSVSLREFAGGSERQGLALVLSDGLDPAISGALRILGGRGHEIAFLHILSNEEIDPDIEGDLRLLDAESGKSIEITANSGALKAYKQKLQEHCDAIANETRRLGGRYLRVVSGWDVAEVLGLLKREGWVTS